MKKAIICVNYRSNPDQPSCAARGSKDLASCLEHEISSQGINIEVERSACLGFCEIGPNLKLAPEGRFIHYLTKQDIPALLQELKQISSM